jgi:hypothetical protein
MSKPTRRFGVELNVNRLMLLIGLMCEQLGRPREGEEILRAMRAYREDLPHPRTYLALCLISQGRLREAADELEACMKEFPGHQLAKVLLGIAWRESGRQDWRTLVQGVIDDGRDEHAVKFAQETLGAETDTRKSHDAGAYEPQQGRLYA